MNRVLRRVLRWWSGSTTPLKVVRVIAFYTGSESGLGFCEYLRWDPETFSGHGWEDHVRHYTDFSDDFRLEIRILEHGRKRRVILYPGEPCDPTFTTKHRRVVVAATLVPRPDSGAPLVDVTHRMQKYMGTIDTIRSAHDMFPFDDPDDNHARFSHVRIFDLTMKVTDVPFVLSSSS